jgi:GNAT superfamily N-acetyltransferase
MTDIRELDLEDDRDFELMVVHIEKLYTELFGPNAVPSLQDLARLRHQLSTRPMSWVFLARDADGEPLAFVTLAESFAVFARGHYGIIGELWVRKDARSQGAGALMLEHCKAFGHARGWKRIDVSAPTDPKWDRSFDFYIKRGFTLTGRKLKCLLGEE